MSKAPEAPEWGSIINGILADDVRVPQPGMPATVLGWSERWPATVGSVYPTLVLVRLDRWTYIGPPGPLDEAQDWTYAPDPAAEPLYFMRLRKGPKAGRWYENGKKDGRSIYFGSRERYADPAIANVPIDPP